VCCRGVIRIIILSLSFFLLLLLLLKINGCLQMMNNDSFVVFLLKGDNFLFFLLLIRSFQERKHQKRLSSFLSNEIPSSSLFNSTYPISIKCQSNHYIWFLILYLLLFRCRRFYFNRTIIY
jgi:hypothetical protein